MTRINKFATIALILLVTMSSCKYINKDIFEGETSAFGKYVERIDTLKLHQCLSEIMKADTSHRKSDFIVKHYYDSIINSSEYTPVWFSNEGLSNDCNTFLNCLQQELPNSGLNPDAFFLTEITDDIEIVNKLAFDSLNIDINKILSRLDYNLSKAYVRYTTGQRYGFVRPDKMLNSLYYREDRGYYAHLFDYTVTPPDYYAALNKLTSEDRMEYLESSKPANNDIYESLKTEYAKAKDKDERNKIAVNMERCRWSLKHPDKAARKVLVNIPSQQLWATGGDTVLSMKICCGAWDTKTPLLCSEISYMQVNPEWSLPPKIVESDFKRHVGDSAWFARHKYFVVNRKTGDTLNIAHLGVNAMRNQGLRFVQRGGAGNSLGRIVFRFASSFSVYLHDTNTPSAFNKERRTLSHGCVRVEKPFELACFLLPDMDEWEKDRLRISMDIPAQTERGLNWLSKNSGKPRPYRLFTYHAVRPKVPVYIVYYTVYPNPATGIMEIWPDFYGYDKAIRKSMGSMLADNF